MGPSSSAAIDGSVSLVEPVPQPKRYLPPAGSKVGSVSRRQPANSIRTVGPPMWVSQTSMGSPYAHTTLVVGG
ncbi:MAG: hypothetical protein QOF06_1075 [Solirubrobacterales bacterium]|jgi:hypothetical protein|nr:hypothetical protein [Solirubrobacterales bacterium]